MKIEDVQQLGEFPDDVWAGSPHTAIRFKPYRVEKTWVSQDGTTARLFIPSVPKSQSTGGWFPAEAWTRVPNPKGAAKGGAAKGAAKPGRESGASTRGAR